MLRRLLLLVILFASADAFAGIYIHNVHPSNGSICFPNQATACADVGGTITGGQCRISGVNRGFMSCSPVTACPPGYSVDAGVCKKDPVQEPCDWPKTGMKPNCSCPSSGTTSEKTFEITVGENEQYCKKVDINGCPHNICGSGAEPVPIDDSGKNCYQSAAGELTCWVKPVATDPVAPCEGDSCPPPLPSPTPIEEPKEIGNPSNSTQTTTDPETGATEQTDSETKRQVNPDGSTTETETITKTQTDSNGTTTTVTTNTKNRSTDGTTTTTTRTDVTGPDGTTKTVVEGTSTEGEEAKSGEGECDPESPNYLECVGMLDEVGDGDAQAILDGIAQAGTTAITDHADSFASSLADGNDVAEPSALRSLINAVLPSPTSCSDLSMSFKGHTMSISCSKMAPLREWLGWFFAVLTMITIYYIALRPQGSN